jgi:hypothetical protein
MAGYTNKIVQILFMGNVIDFCLQKLEQLFALAKIEKA